MMEFIAEFKLTQLIEYAIVLCVLCCLHSVKTLRKLQLISVKLRINSINFTHFRCSDLTGSNFVDVEFYLDLCVCSDSCGNDTWP